MMWVEREAGATSGPHAQVKINSSGKCSQMDVKKPSDPFRPLMRLAVFEMVHREQLSPTEVGMLVL